MKPSVFFVFFVLALFCCSESSDPPVIQPPASGALSVRAADISFLPEIRIEGTEFKNSDGVTKDVLDILKEAGCNTIRVRLWHSPADGFSGLNSVSDFASEIKSKGFKLWLVIHYSDIWADPGHQTKPALWNNLSLTDLSDSVYKYTKKVVTRLQPDFVQIGNEINSGFLWPEGNITNLTNFITLVKDAGNGIADSGVNTKVMMHFAGIDGAEWFYNILKTNTVQYDIIALSYYPRWHTKSLLLVKNTLNQLSATHAKEIIIAETGYPFTLEWNDWTNNLVGLEEHLIPGYPASTKGQYDFLAELRKIISQTNGGIGIAYWSPEWVAYKGNQATDGSPWENMALFDFNNKAVEGMNIFIEK